MPWNLERFQHAGDLHFITFSCHNRLPLLGTPAARDRFEQALEKTRRACTLHVHGYVIMPEHVHLLVSEPLALPGKTGTLAAAIQSLKQFASPGTGPFWLPRYYDFNVFTRKKRIEKLHYIHHNPVARGLVAAPEDWPWSSYRHHTTGAPGSVHLHSPWTAADLRTNRVPHSGR